MTQYSRWQERQRTGAVTRTSQLDDLRQRIHVFVIEQLGPLLTDQRLGEAETRKLVHEQLIRALAEEQIALSAAERQQVIQDVTDDVLGYGPIDRFLRDTTITEVMVNGPKSVYVERRGKIERTDVEFVDENHLRRIIDKIVAQVGRRIDEATPMVDARLPDGSRINAVVNPVAIGGPFLTIRKFSSTPFTVADLINFGTMTPQTAHFLDACVRGRLNVVV
ncbi:MAG TPA: ATPase, T2SS/T4P/T4SS family, partial [Acidimicrobiia bacterium]|nr:ATPase, T2SS/T4P/T4SS family [Acidimicrobiia bacterium]